MTPGGQPPPSRWFLEPMAKPAAHPPEYLCQDEDNSVLTDLFRYVDICGLACEYPLNWRSFCHGRFGVSGSFEGNLGADRR